VPPQELDPKTGEIIQNSQGSTGSGKANGGVMASSENMGEDGAAAATTSPSESEEDDGSMPFQG